MARWRRLVRDDESRLDVSKAMIHVATGSLLLRHIAPAWPFWSRLGGRVEAGRGADAPVQETFTSIGFGPMFVPIALLGKSRQIGGIDETT